MRQISASVTALTAANIYPLRRQYIALAEQRHRNGIPAFRVRLPYASQARVTPVTYAVERAGHHHAG